MESTEAGLSRSEAIALTGRLLHERFAEADFAFAAGSTMRGTATPSSDIDLVLIYPALPHAHRQSLVFRGVPFEIFAHDETTLRWFFAADVASGRPVLIRMVAEGVPIGTRLAKAESLCQEAGALLTKGPPPLNEDVLDRMRYGISDMLTDLADKRPDFERVAIGAALYQALGDFILRSNGRWTGAGKWLPREIRAYDATLGGVFIAAFDALFREGDDSAVRDLADRLLAPFGGLLFDGYRNEAPAEWRK